MTRVAGADADAQNERRKNDVSLDVSNNNGNAAFSNIVVQLPEHA